MPIDPAAAIEVTAYRRVPDMARGFVKDMRVRWALEEIGLSYRVRLVGGVFGHKSPEHLADQPFGQVPVYKEPGIALFESGAILLHLGGRDERLLPAEPSARGRAITWLFAALNSIEPVLGTLFMTRLMSEGKAWREEAMGFARPFSETRLSQLSTALGDREWLEDRFTIGDLAMADVLRAAPDPALIAAHPNLAAYVERATARPAFQAALAAHLADLEETEA